MRLIDPATGKKINPVFSDGKLYISRGLINGCQSIFLLEEGTVLVFENNKKRPLWQIYDALYNCHRGVKITL
jgi:hypothetical protein